MISGCTTKPLESQDTEDRVPVRIEEAIRGTFSQHVELAGRTKSRIDFPIIAPSPLMVKEIYVQIGDEVKEGASLLLFDDEEAQQQLTEARKQLATLEKNVKDLQALQQQALEANRAIQQESEESVRRAQALIEGSQTGAVTMLDLLQASTQLLVRQNQMQNLPDMSALQPAQLELQVEQARTQIRMAEESIQRLTIKAPFDGVITLRNIEAKGVAVPNYPILQISNLDQIVIELQVGSTQIGQLQQGQKASVLIEGANEALEASLDYLSPGIGPQSPLYQAQIILDNQERRLFPGQLATVQLETLVMEEALLIPVQAVFFEDEKSFVYLVQEQKAVKKEVQLGERNQSHYVVLSGLDEQDPVITMGRERLTEGRLVYIQK